MLIKYPGARCTSSATVVQWDLTTYTNAFRRYRQPIAKETLAIPPRRTRRMTLEDFTRRMSQEFPSVPELTAAQPGGRETFVRIPEGWFQMGSEDGPEDAGPVHRVWVDAFEMAIHPVTCAQYAGFLGATGHERPRDWSLFAVAGDLPVVGVSWLDCEAYCRWRNETDAREASTAGQQKPLRLPTEAEWSAPRAAAWTAGGIPGETRLPAGFPRKDAVRWRVRGRSRSASRTDSGWSASARTSMSGAPTGTRRTSMPRLPTATHRGPNAASAGRRAGDPGAMP